MFRRLYTGVSALFSPGALVLSMLLGSSSWAWAQPPARTATTVPARSPVSPNLDSLSGLAHYFRTVRERQRTKSAAQEAIERFLADLIFNDPALVNALKRSTPPKRNRREKRASNTSSSIRSSCSSAPIPRIPLIGTHIVGPLISSRERRVLQRRLHLAAFGKQ